MGRLLGLLLILALPLGCVPPPEPLKVRAEKVDLPTEASDAIRAVLNSDALIIPDARNEPWLTFWLRPELPTSATPEQAANGLTYEEIPSTTLIGIVRIHKPWTDFRKQVMQAGIYSLRITIQPKTGEHEDTAPYTDFCLLTPIEKDPSPDRIEVRTLHSRSKSTTGGVHPGVMLMFPNYKPKDVPEMTREPDGIELLRVKRTVKVGDKVSPFGIGLVIAGATKAG